MERKSLERSNYEKLLELVPDILTLPEYKKLTSPGMMDLGIDVLETTETFRIVALSHYFFVNGDGIADPDVQIRIFPSERRVEVLAYQDQFGYQQVYLDEGVYRATLKLKLDQFLDFWLNNLLNQGYTESPR